jgi:ATP-dependent Clp protease adaptor protein ClpS
MVRTMSDLSAASSTALREREAPDPEHAWQTVVWDDPVNLISYVSYVFQTHFGFDTERADRLMLQVHQQGSAVVAEGSLEAMELHVEAMHSYGLWATVRRAGSQGGSQ